MLLHSFTNVIVLILLVSFALNYQVKWNNEVARSHMSLVSYLFGETESTVDLPRHRIETIDEFLTILDDTVNSYYSLPSASSGTFMHYLESIDTETIEAQMHRRHPKMRISAPHLALIFHNGTDDSPEYDKLIRATFPLMPSNRLGPFQQPDALSLPRYSCLPAEDVDRAFFIPCRATSIGDLFARLVHVHLNFSLYSFERGDEGEAVPVSWDVRVSFDLTGHNSVMDMASRLSYRALKHPHRVPILIASALLVAACFDAFLRVKDVCQTARPRATAGILTLSPSGGDCRASSDTPAAVPPLPVSTLLTAQEGGWKWLGFVSNALTISFACATLHRQLFCSTTFLAREQALTLLLGFASMASSFMLISLLKFFPSHYVLIDALLTSSRHLGLFALGVIPPLVGYAMCGTALFGGFGPFFAHVPTSLVTLICSTFGDNLMETFTSVDQSAYWLHIWCARLFFFTFLLLFICNVLNVAHSIIQESYSVAVSSFTAQKARATLADSVCSGDSDAVEGGAVNDATGEILNSQGIEAMLRKLHPSCMSTSAQPVS